MPLDDHFAPNGAIAIRHLGAEVAVGSGADNSSKHSGRPLNGVDARFLYIEGPAGPPPVGMPVEIESRHQRQFEPRLDVPRIADCQGREAALKEADLCEVVPGDAFRAFHAGFYGWNGVIRWFPSHTTGFALRFARNGKLDAVTGQIVAASLTSKEVDDAAKVGPLLDQVAMPVASFTADGAYDQDRVYIDVSQ
jgi:hypothetical protein